MRQILDKDSAVSVGLALVLAGLLVSAIWWASGMDTRLQNVEERVQPIPQLQQDMAIIKNILLNDKQVVKSR